MLSSRSRTQRASFSTNTLPLAAVGPSFVVKPPNRAFGSTGSLTKRRYSEVKRYNVYYAYSLLCIEWTMYTFCAVQSLLTNYWDIPINCSFLSLLPFTLLPTHTHTHTHKHTHTDWFPLWSDGDVQKARGFGGGILCHRLQGNQSDQWAVSGSQRDQA